ALVVLAEKTRIVGFVNRALQCLALADEFAADVDVRSVSAHCETGDQAAFDQRMRVVAQDFTILAGARLGFVGIDDEVMRTIAFLRHEGPLQTGREACTTTTTKTGCLHLVDDPVATLVD